jgi:hypothetical protein
MLTEPLQELLRRALKFSGVDADAPRIKWADPFPLGDDERADIIEKRTGGKATLSRETTLQNFDGMSPEEAQEEVKRIEGEEAYGPDRPFAGFTADQPRPADDTPEEA